eukprot:TRINITY_DN5566_c0_g3_i2.p1 TRINITY_DN5566_c0_g3~~TRINITY_DN5566_c0_g3_i2.p1  ORF type:complete len:302 (-),score=103.36 TRINITY_DN5566_c0_g3_i2:25-930(-)
MSEKYQQKLDELEKHAVDQDLNTLRQIDERASVSLQLQELRDKYTDFVKERLALQKQLYAAEEDKINISKALLEMEVENAKLREMLQSNQLEQRSSNIGDEATDLEIRIKLEKAQELVKELQAELAKELEEKKALESEFVTLRKNYMNKSNDLNELKKKNEALELELVNLLNENKALSNYPLGAPKTANSARSSEGNYGKQAENELDGLRDENAQLNAELEKTKAEKLKAEIAAERAKVDYEEKSVKLEKKFLAIPIANVQAEPETSALKKVEREDWELSLIHICRCRRIERCRSRWSPYH